MPSFEFWPFTEHIVSLSEEVTALVATVNFNLGSEKGEFGLEMAVYEDENYEKLARSNHTFIVPEMIYVGVDIIDNNEFVPTLKKCWATPS